MYFFIPNFFINSSVFIDFDVDVSTYARFAFVGEQCARVLGLVAEMICDVKLSFGQTALSAHLD